MSALKWPPPDNAYTRLFTTKDTRKLLDNKFVVIIGDSVQRGIYKAMVACHQGSKLSEKHLRAKGESSHLGDTLIERSDLINASSYEEVRQYQTDKFLLRFYFITKVYSAYMETVLCDLGKEPEPDVIIMNSCLWDVSRYGVRNSLENYVVGLEKLCLRLKEVIPKHCLVIWNTAMPIAVTCRGGFMPKGMSFLNDTLRMDLLEGNLFAHQVFVSHGFDVLDLHYQFRRKIELRTADGVHWNVTANQMILCFLFTHIGLSWNTTLPVDRATFEDVDDHVTLWQEDEAVKEDQGLYRREVCPYVRPSSRPSYSQRSMKSIRSSREIREDIRQRQRHNDNLRYSSDWGTIPLMSLPPSHGMENMNMPNYMHGAAAYQHQAVDQDYRYMYNNENNSNFAMHQRSVQMLNTYSSYAPQNQNFWMDSPGPTYHRNFLYRS